MTFVPPKNRVLEHSTSNSQTVFAVTGAIDTSFNAFSAHMSVGDTTIGFVAEPGVAFKAGLLTYSAANEITVTTADETKGTFSSSGTKEVGMGIPPKRLLMVDGPGELTAAQQQTVRANVLSPGPEAVGALGSHVNPFMEISQQNGTTAGTTTLYYPVDEVRSSFISTIGTPGVITAQQVTPSYATAGFYRLLHAARLKATTVFSSYNATDYMNPVARFEGLNWRRYGWGTADAVDILIVAVLVASVTGTYCINVQNAAFDRTYITTVSLTANVPKCVAVRIPGDTSGTWVTTNAHAANIGIGALTGSTYQIGSLNTWTAGNYNSHSSATNWTATSNATLDVAYFNIFPYGFLPIEVTAGTAVDIGASYPELLARLLNSRLSYDEYLHRCFRYCWGFNTAADNDAVFGVGYGYSTSLGVVMRPLPRVMMTAPTLPTVSNVSHFYGLIAGNNALAVTDISISRASPSDVFLSVTLSGTPLTAGDGFGLASNSTSARLVFTARV